MASLAAQRVITPGSDSSESVTKRRRMCHEGTIFSQEHGASDGGGVFGDSDNKSSIFGAFGAQTSSSSQSSPWDRKRTSPMDQKATNSSAPQNQDPDTYSNTHVVTIAGTRFEIDKKYEPIKPIGHGAYGVVIACQDRVTGEKVAIKKIPGAFNDIIDAKRVLREIKLLLHFDHDNLMHAIEILRPPSLAAFTDIYIVSPLMETDLHRIIYSKQELSDDHAQYFIYQILRALKYMHSAEVLHRDLKPSNLLLNSNCDLKICDFGLARGLHEDTDLTEYVVTRWYRAPEIMLSCQEYSKAVDVWSVGCIFAELIARKPLFPGEDYIHQLQLISQVLGTPSDSDMHFIRSENARRFMRNLPCRTKVPWTAAFPKANLLALDLLGKMLVFDPAKRITVADALKHEYMESLHCEEDEPVSDFRFDFGFDKEINSTAAVRDNIFRDILARFHPKACAATDQNTACPPVPPTAAAAPSARPPLAPPQSQLKQQVSVSSAVPGTSATAAEIGSDGIAGGALGAASGAAEPVCSVTNGAGTSTSASFVSASAT